MVQITKEMFTKKRIVLLIVSLCLIATIIFALCYFGNEYNRPYKRVMAVYTESGYSDFEAESYVAFEFDDREECTEADYNAWVDRGGVNHSGAAINADGTYGNGMKIREAKKLVGTYNYYKESGSYNYTTGKYDYKYYKALCTDVVVSYVKIKFVNENTIRIKYYDRYEQAYMTVQCTFDSYMIAYFN